MNVILIAIDTLRADHLSGYGYKCLTSPHMDKIASEGVAFEGFYSPHIPTHPAFTTMMTGVDVMTHQIVAQGGKVDLDPKVLTLAQVLKSQGYFTAAADNMGRWFSRGFDTYEGYSWERDPKAPWHKAEAVNGTALKILERAARQDKPFFLFFHYWDPHTPYLPPSPYSRMFYGGDEKAPSNHSMDALFAFEPFKVYFEQWMGGTTDIEFTIAQYDAEIAYCDAALAHIFNRIEELDLADDTLLILVADHGEEMDEHQMWFDHHGLYDTNLHVPLIMRCPGKLPAGKRISGLARMFDLAPTILDFLGLSGIAQEANMEGSSLLPLVKSNRGRKKEVCSELFLTECTWMRKRGIRTREWKYIRSSEPDIHNRPPKELYHLVDDPGELKNLADEMPEIVKDLEGRLTDWVKGRLDQTKKVDPIETQGITLRSVRVMATAVPENQKL